MRLPYFLIIVTALSALFQLPAVQAQVIWHNDLILSGQWWRILTGNMTHTNIIHLIMNMAALWVISYLFRPTSRSLFWILVLLSFFVGMGLLLSSLHIYAGTSGVLHGIFAYYALREALDGRKSSWLLVAGVIVKIGYEQLYGASESTAQLIAAEVATEAHMIGTITGISMAIVLYLVTKRNGQYEKDKI